MGEASIAASSIRMSSASLIGACLLDPLRAHSIELLDELAQEFLTGINGNNNRNRDRDFQVACSRSLDGGAWHNKRPR